jgi:autonomous glycyl radical cofactor GrcA
MVGELHNLRLKLQRSGWLDGRRVDGWLFEDERGNLGWHIRTWPNGGDPVDDYWVEGSEFYEVLRLDLAMKATPTNRIETGRRIIEMDVAKRDTILIAIGEWKKSVDEEHSSTKESQR